MHSAIFLQDLAVVMIVAGLVTIIFRRFHQPVVLGYIIAGVIIGPHTPPYQLIKDEVTIKTLAEMGVIFLMFSLGLEFSLRKLKKVGFTAFIAAALEIMLMVFVGYEIGRAFGWKTMDCLFLGAMLSISSTTIIVKALGELGRSREYFAELIFGILIVEDVLAIVMIALLSGIAMTGSLSVGEVLNTTGRLGIFLVVAVVLGLLVVPRLLGYVARFKSSEVLLITVLGLCFGVSLLAVKLNYSVALGAFVIGAVIAEAREIHRIEVLMAPIRDMFSAVFFVAIGLLIDPKLLLQYALPIVVITLAVVVGKVVTCSFGAFVAGNDTRTSLRVGLGLAQIGEFSFIIAALGLTLNVTSSFLYPIAVTVSAFTTLLTPYLIRHADKIVALHDRFAPASLRSYQQDYLAWVQRLQQNRETSGPRKLIRKMAWQLAVNAALIAGLFLAAALVDQLDIAWLRDLPFWTGGKKTVLWLAAMFASLPIFVATIRKLQAMSMLLSEMTFREHPSRERLMAFRAVVSNTTLFTGIIGLGLLVLLLSSALLPPWQIAIVLISIAVLVAILLKAFFIRIYARAQFTIREVLTREPAPPPAAPAKALPALLEEADLLTVTITSDSSVLGKRIRETELRSKTGATVVVVKRGAETIVNPDPDFTFQLNDQVLLLGSASQLQLAEALLTASPEAVLDRST